MLLLVSRSDPVRSELDAEKVARPVVNECRDTFCLQTCIIEGTMSDPTNHFRETSTIASAWPRSSPVGTAVSDHIKDSLNDPEFRAEYERLAPCEELARIVIMRRAALGLAQAELAARLGATASAISRIESGHVKVGFMVPDAA
jgi:DNA-binding transcriptional regulator YiaG